MSQQQFLVNKSAGHVALHEGKLFVPNGGFRTVTENELLSVDVKDAVDRGWLEVTSVYPGVAPDGVKPTLTFENEKAKGSLYPPGKEPKVEVQATTVVEGDGGSQAAQPEAVVDVAEVKVPKKKAATA